MLFQYLKKDFFIDIEHIDITDLKEKCRKLKINENRIYLIEKRYYKSKYVFQDFWNDYFKNKKKVIKRPKMSTFVPKVTRDDPEIEEIKKKPKVTKSTKKIAVHKSTKKKEKNKNPFAVTRSNKKKNFLNQTSDLPIISKKKNYPSNRRFRDEGMRSNLKKKKSILEEKLFTAKSKSKKQTKKNSIYSLRKIKKTNPNIKNGNKPRTPKAVTKKKSILKNSQSGRLTMNDRKKSFMNEIQKHSKKPIKKSKSKKSFLKTKSTSDFRKKIQNYRVDTTDKKKRKF
jgi:hypothetical protein